MIGHHAAGHQFSSSHQLERHMRALKKRYRVLPLRDVAEPLREETLDKSVVITFNGYREQSRSPATVLKGSVAVHESLCYMWWSQEEIAEQGILALV